ncbi:hypothetical protein FOG18_10265 [Legionella israelensis]|uniref:hypothetical protein n=1 Tax=Legionella israelensis TaxID=454 RepID=UPI00117CF977|nr:hypothetical protein [Legionella israelensis]QDP72918.1 hypothetical protein FOG18_10265 [Legionella israelensis]
MKVELFPVQIQAKSLDVIKGQDCFSSFESFLKSPAGQMTEDQYHLTQQDYLEQSSLNFQWQKPSQYHYDQRQNFIETRANKDDFLGIDLVQNLKNDISLDFTIKEVSNRTEEFQSQELLGFIKKQLPTISLLNLRTSEIKEKTLVKPEQSAEPIKNSIKFHHQKFHLYLCENTVELSFHCENISKEELTHLIASIKFILLKKGLQLTVLKINGVKQ